MTELDMIDRIARNPKGRRALLHMVDYMRVYIDEYPESIDLKNPYLLAMIRIDILERIAAHIGIDLWQNRTVV